MSRQSLPLSFVLLIAWSVYLAAAEYTVRGRLHITAAGVHNPIIRMPVDLAELIPDLQDSPGVWVRNARLGDTEVPVPVQMLDENGDGRGILVWRHPQALAEERDVTVLLNAEPAQGPEPGFGHYGELSVQQNHPNRITLENAALTLEIRNGAPVRYYSKALGHFQEGAKLPVHVFVRGRQTEPDRFDIDLSGARGHASLEAAGPVCIRLRVRGEKEQAKSTYSIDLFAGAPYCEYTFQPAVDYSVAVALVPNQTYEDADRQFFAKTESLAALQAGPQQGVVEHGILGLYDSSKPASALAVVWDESVPGAESASVIPYNRDPYGKRNVLWIGPLARGAQPLIAPLVPLKLRIGEVPCGENAWFDGIMTMHRDISEPASATPLAAVFARTESAALPESAVSAALPVSMKPLRLPEESRVIDAYSRRAQTQRNRLPVGGWHFRTDPEDELEQDKTVLSGEAASEWAEISVGKAWEKQGYEGYDGAAWYARRLVFPDTAGTPQITLLFGGVDEEAWIWLDGHAIGKHAEGPPGWDKPFMIPIPSELAVPGEHRLVIKVYDSMLAGGIYKPVHILYETRTLPGRSEKTVHTKLARAIVSGASAPAMLEVPAGRPLTLGVWLDSTIRSLSRMPRLFTVRAGAVSKTALVSLKEGPAAISLNVPAEETVTGELPVSSCTGQTAEFCWMNALDVTVMPLPDTILPAPRLESPARQALILREETPFEWVPDSEAPAERYRLEVATDLAFDERIAQAETTSHKAVLTLPDGIYYWRVAAKQGSREQHSAVRQLEVDAVRPPAPVNVEASTDAVTGDILLNWQAGDGEMPAFYNIYRTRTAAAPVTAATLHVKDVRGTTFRDHATRRWKTYSYRIVPFAASGRPGTPSAPVRIRSEKRLFTAGGMFPLFMYWAQPDDAAEIAEIGFNIVAARGVTSLDASRGEPVWHMAPAYGNERTADAFMHHPKTLLFNSDDEPHGLVNKRMRDVLQRIRALSPDHYIFLNDMPWTMTTAVQLYADVFSSDPYPYPALNPVFVEKSVRRQWALAGGLWASRIQWCVLQGFGWYYGVGEDNNRADYQKAILPFSAAELRAQWHHALAGGAQGIAVHRWRSGSDGAGLLSFPWALHEYALMAHELKGYGQYLLDAGYAGELKTDAPPLIRYWRTADFAPGTRNHAKYLGHLKDSESAVFPAVRAVARRHNRGWFVFVTIPGELDSGYFYDEPVTVTVGTAGHRENMALFEIGFPHATQRELRPVEQGYEFSVPDVPVARVFLLTDEPDFAREVMDEIRANRRKAALFSYEIAVDTLGLCEKLQKSWSQPIAETQAMRKEMLKGSETVRELADACEDIPAFAHDAADARYRAERRLWQIEHQSPWEIGRAHV